jgi:hypothetical protein
MQLSVASVLTAAFGCSIIIVLGEQPPHELDHWLLLLLAIVLILSNFVWCDWSHLPWQVFNDPMLQWELMPSFLLIEYTYFALFGLTLYHAVATNSLRLWFSSG